MALDEKSKEISAYVRGFTHGMWVMLIAAVVIILVYGWIAG